MTAPAWFEAAMAITPTEHDVTNVHYLRWGTRGARPILLVHGASAHARWWSHLAPLLLDADIVAFDLPGHGESGRAESYTLESFANAMAAVVADARFASPPTVIAHSFGGLVATAAIALHPELASGLVVVDTALGEVPAEVIARTARAQRVYPLTESPAARFSLMPPQPHTNQFILDAVAETAVKRTSDGWTWRFDPRIFSYRPERPLEEYVSAVRCRSAVFCGEHSVVMTPANATRFASLLGTTIQVTIPDAHHHLILDQPLAFIAAIRTLLATWK